MVPERIPNRLGAMNVELCQGLRARPTNDPYFGHTVTPTIVPVDFEAARFRRGDHLRVRRPGGYSHHGFSAGCRRLIRLRRSLGVLTGY